jgi:hypothetical protein
MQCKIESQIAEDGTDYHKSTEILGHQLDR